MGSPVSEAADRQLNLIGFGYLLALSTDAARNLIASLRYDPEFGHRSVFTLADGSSRKTSARNRTAKQHRRLHLFSEDATAGSLLDKMEKGWTLKATGLTEQFEWVQYQQQFTAGFLALFVLHKNGKLQVINSDQSQPEPRAGDQILALVAPDVAPTEDAH